MSKRRNNTFGHQLTKNKRRKTTKKEVRNWLDLPTDVMLLIFMKLGPVEIILNAQYVCSLWRKLAKEPHLFHAIIVPHHQHHFHCCNEATGLRKFDMFFEEAIVRSCGQLVKLSFENFLTQELLLQVVSKPNSLKSLRIGMEVGYSLNGFFEIIKRLPLLEELDVGNGFYTCHQFEVISFFCPKLKHLRVEYYCGSPYEPRDYDEHAFAIAKNMPHLHSLHLIRSAMTNKGLQAIQEGFPKLKYLDLRSCFKLTLDGDVSKKRVCRYRHISF
ncbi:hypothetical protein AQUCO_09700009v1 [Aquilegia coerulea]|uniref:F-box domain-containing protein n=1 Tax=Aquilegia coerulea TaxID=218851 RepID=A0A2G5C4H4_AQUCA|nr:hypothetical protein AQUCO_09700009v1 [Aquilegia coerulea]